MKKDSETCWKPGEAINHTSGTMVEINPKEVTQRDLYKLIIGSIVPRPIAFVSTIGKDGSTNLAPYSFFNGVSSNPPCVMFSVGVPSSGEKKDTLKNIEETKEFVINSSNEWLLDPLVYSAANYPYGVSEIEETGLTAISGKIVSAPRIKEAAVQLECRLHKIVEIGDGSPGSASIVFGEIVYAHVDEECYEDGRINFEKYRAIGRLGGYQYGTIGEIIEKPIPKISDLK